MSASSRDTEHSAPTVLFVGESPPPGAPAKFRPFDCASGTRLARHMLGLVDRAALLEHVPRTNVFDQPTGAKGCPSWPSAQAREHAAELLRIHQGQGIRAFVLLGARVCEAFGASHLPGPVAISALMEFLGPTVLVRAPHPSGASTVLNAPETVREVRRALLPELVLGCPTLRPWHFRLDDPVVAEDLAVALSPHDPRLGLAAIGWVMGRKRLWDAAPPGSLLSRIAGIEGTTNAAGAARAGVWDEPLTRIARDLGRGADGVSDLCRRWDPEARGVSWLAVEAANVAPTSRPPPHLAAAIDLRYAVGGLW